MRSDLFGGRDPRNIKLRMCDDEKSAPQLAVPTYSQLLIIPRTGDGVFFVAGNVY